MSTWPALGRKGRLCLLLSLFIIPAMLVASLNKAAAVPLFYQSFCNSLGSKIQASSGVQMYCKGPQANGMSAMLNPKLRQRMGLPPLRGGFQITHPLGSRFVRIPLRPNWMVASPAVSSNIDAANPNEDITPSGFQAYGQSEVSIAAQGHNVVEAWNDATGFFAPCVSPNYKEELTGFGYSGDNGASFQDQGGLPNDNCANWKFSGDPTVETYLGLDGNTYFYIASLYLPTGNSPVTQIAMDACQAVVGDPFLTCTTIPIIVATSETQRSFLDKDFASIDQRRGRLYVSYTDFGAGTGNGDIKLAMCKLEPNPLSPTCVQPQPDPSVPEVPYLVVHPSETCENEGAYPAVDKATGDVYVAYEHNWATNIFSSACNTTSTTVRVSRIPAACLPATSPSSCSGPFATGEIAIASMDAAFIPGYNRFPMNDFPRIAVSDPYGTVTIVWNDARYRPSGDILLESYYLGSGFPTPVQGTFFGGATPIRVSNNTSPTFDILPALRNPDQNGHLNISWFDRRNSDADDRSFTDVFAATGVNPRTTTTPGNFKVTDVGSDWLSVSSDIVPNFGDYTDIYVNAKIGTQTNTGLRVYPAWSDGRLGDPQPFNAHYGSL